MKTALEILEQHWFLPELGKSNAVVAMQEYARQVAESVKAEVAKIAFEGVDVEYNITFMDIEQFIK